MQPDTTQLNELIRRICSVAKPVKIILFGSAARGEMKPESDLDVLVIVSKDTNTRQVSRHINRNLIGFRMSADVIVATEDDLSRYKDNPGMVYYPALREGREIYAA